MNVLGLFNPETNFGKKLKQGGACIISDNEIIVSISEERITRKKNDYGYSRSIDYCLDFAGMRNHDIDLVVTSSCCEYKAIISNDLSSRFKRTEICNHHLSHAYSTYYCSQFDSAIIIVIDGGGNTLEESNKLEWWKLSREQVSIYLARDGKIELIQKVYLHPYDTGFGETFRCFTKYLGFGSTSNVGKVMALSGCDILSGLENKNIFLNNGSIETPFPNLPNNPIDTLQSYLIKSGINTPPREPTEQIEEKHIKLASFVQLSYQLSLKYLVDKYISSLNVNNVCIAGGVGLNCIANSYILSECDSLNKLFVQPASSDTGQCLGNAIYGHSLLSSLKPRLEFKGVYLGKNYKIDKVTIYKLINGNNEYGFSKIKDYKKIAKFISDGKIIGWFQGRSEFGPRALGNRSILGDPRNIQVSKKINTLIKKREEFMPFAASILSEECESFLSGNVCEYMTLAPKVRQDKRRFIPAVTHVDGSCRAHKVEYKKNTNFYALIKDFYKLSGIPMLLNTSLNGLDEPICETPGDAFNLFKNYPLDYLVIGDYFLYKK